MSSYLGTKRRKLQIHTQVAANTTPQHCDCGLSWSWQFSQFWCGRSWGLSRCPPATATPTSVYSLYRGLPICWSNNWDQHKYSQIHQNSPPWPRLIIHNRDNHCDMARHDCRVLLSAAIGAQHTKIITLQLWNFSEALALSLLDWNFSTIFWSLENVSIFL